MFQTKLKLIMLVAAFAAIASTAYAGCDFEYVFNPSGNETSDSFVINCCSHCSPTATVWVQSCGGTDYVVIEKETYPGSRVWNTVSTVNPSSCTGQATGTFTAHVDQNYRIVSYAGSCGGGDAIVDVYFNTTPSAGTCP